MRGKIFVFLGMVEGTLRVGVKLPTSFEMALTLPYVEPSGYGLGRAGWVTAPFTARAEAGRRAVQGLDRPELPRGRAEETGRGPRRRAPKARP